MIGSRILEMRQKMNWSQARLAKELNVSVKTIKNWENESSDPSVKNIIQLTKIFSISSDYLLGIDNHCTIYLDSLSHDDQLCLRGMCQIFISNAQKKI